MSRQFVFTRSAALDRLAEVAPRAGHAYAANRNTDLGPETEPTTTALSPYLRRRLLLEQDAIQAVLAVHGPKTAGKFIEEMFWRSYFKGHLETHPSAWTHYIATVADERRHLAENAGLRKAHHAAISGSTGIDCFDDWAQQLTHTGWLHNHTRMWFASIWIFTLRLPWVLGADFFLQHLLDGDPASNTLSWRWVAGLHTRGKAYAARAENIRRYTAGRYAPTALNESPAPLQETDPPPAIRLSPGDKAPSTEVALLLHLDDLNPESLDLGDAKVIRIGSLLAHASDASNQVRHADTEAMHDALARAERRFGCTAGPALPGWAGELPIVTAWAPVGPSAAALPPGCLRIRRQWDELTWPHSTRGYFQMRTAIPEILRATSLL